MVLVNALTSTALIATYAIWLAPLRAPRIAVLDVTELYRLKERQIANALIKPDTSDTERTAALKRAGEFGTEITALIERLPAECGCLILARGALVGSAVDLPDMTPAVRQRLKL